MIELKNMEKTFPKKLANLFNSNPSLVSFGWTQYASPVSDDGSISLGSLGDTPASTFGFPDINAVPGLELSAEHVPEAKLQKVVATFLRNVAPDLLVLKFGDGIKVTVCRNGTKALSPAPTDVRFEKTRAVRFEVLNLDFCYRDSSNRVYATVFGRDEAPIAGALVRNDEFVELVRSVRVDESSTGSRSDGLRLVRWLLEHRTGDEAFQATLRLLEAAQPAN